MRGLRTGMLWLLLLGGGGMALAQTDTVQIKRATELRQGPSETSPAIAPLAAQVTVTRMPERQGPWMRVKSDAGQTGWVHMFDVGTASGASASSNTGTGALRGLTSLFSKPSTQTTATSTIGIRGLGAEDLANAQPNVAAVAQMEALRSDAAQARRFASDAQLSAREVEALPAPPTSTPSSAPASPAGQSSR